MYQLILLSKQLNDLQVVSTTLNFFIRDIVKFGLVLSLTLLGILTRPVPYLSLIIWTFICSTVQITVILKQFIV